MKYYSCLVQVIIIYIYYIVISNKTMKKLRKEISVKTPKPSRKLYSNTVIHKRNSSQTVEEFKNQAFKTITIFNSLRNLTINQPLSGTGLNQRTSATKFQSKDSNKVKNSMLPFKSTITTNHKMETSEVLSNIKSLLKYNVRLFICKTQSISTQSEKLKNPFYKIQKKREHLNFQNEEQKTSKPKKAEYTLKNKSHWYYASKRYHIKQNTQNLCQTTDESITANNENKSLRSSQDSYLPMRPLSRRQQKHPRQIETNYQREKQIAEINQKIKEASQQSSPARIREKSLTVKYNQIKDYFQKKYTKA